jgi:Flp pilus assembly protein protease CpaA
MYEIIFLFALALIFILFATLQDFKKREIADWLSFSLIIFALGFRFFYSLFNENFTFFYQGLIGFGIFFILGNVFYYSRLFAGGDAKLMISLGAILPISYSFMENLNIFLIFLVIFLFIGTIYSMLWVLVLSLKNFRELKKDLSKRIKKFNRINYLIMLFGIITMLFGFLYNLLFFTGALIFIFPILLLYTKSVDEICMIKKIKSNKLAEGDWLYKDVKIGNKTIKTSWNGLTKDEIQLIKKKYQSILIRQGIPFTVVFLISFLMLIIYLIL